MVGELDYVKVPVQEFVVHCPFVIAIIINEPNTVQTVHSTVVANPKNATIMFAKTPALAFVCSADHGKRRNGDRHSDRASGFSFSGHLRSARVQCGETHWYAGGSFVELCRFDVNVELGNFLAWLEANIAE